MRITLPPGTPDEARTAVQRLVELTAILARRCAQLQEALDSRVVIEQAKGILATLLEMPLEQAFELMRWSARSRRLSIHDLATEVVAARADPGRIAVLLFGNAQANGIWRASRLRSVPAGQNAPIAPAAKPAIS